MNIALIIDYQVNSLTIYINSSYSGMIFADNIKVNKLYNDISKFSYEVRISSGRHPSVLYANEIQIINK